MLSALNIAQREEGFDPHVWRLPVRHLSFSSLAMAATCPEKWRRRYVLKEHEPKSPSLQIGSAFHGALERNFRQKIQTHRDMPDIADAYAASWEASLQREEVDWQNIVPGFALTQGLKLVSLYMEQVAPRIQPLAVEQRVQVRVEGLPVPILGFIDLIDEAGMVDYKTSSRAVSGPKASWRIQARTYQLASPVAFSWHVAVKTKEPKVITPLEASALWTPYSEIAVQQCKRQLRDLGWSLNYLIQTLGPDNPWPTNGTMNDSCAICSFRDRGCPAWSV